MCLCYGTSVEKDCSSVLEHLWYLYSVYLIVTVIAILLYNSINHFVLTKDSVSVNEMLRLQNKSIWYFERIQRDRLNWWWTDLSEHDRKNSIYMRICACVHTHTHTHAHMHTHEHAHMRREREWHWSGSNGTLMILNHYHLC